MIGSTRIDQASAGTLPSASLFLRKYRIVTEIRMTNKAGKLLLRKYGLYLNGNRVDANAKAVTATIRLAKYFALKACAAGMPDKRTAIGATRKDRV